MHKQLRIGFAFAVAALSLVVLLCWQHASAQTVQADLPIIGTWRINIQKSSPAFRTRPATWTANYAAINGGIRQTMYDVYPAKYAGLPTTGVAPHDHLYFFKLDGKQLYEDPEGPNGAGQTVAMWSVTPNIIFRQRQTNGSDDERGLYVVSLDGNTLTWYIWYTDPKGATSIVVWDRVR